MPKQPLPPSRPVKPKKKAGRKAAPAAEPVAAKASDRFPIVGIGASAGGFEAMQELLKHLPADTGMAFIFIAHLDPRAKSHAPELLARTTAMPVQEIRHGVRVEPNCVYTLAPAQQVTIADRVLSVEKVGGGRHVILPIDRFFDSLAAAEGPRAIGIILSGTGSDGTLGLAAIKSEGGITFTQSERSAKYTGMPGSAIAAGCVDAALAPTGIVRQLVEIGKHPYVRGQPLVERAGEGGELAEEGDLGKVFQFLRSQTGVNFALYKRTTMQRRLTRRLVLHRISRLREYVKLLRVDTDEVDALYNDLLINVTSFFRDREVFVALQKKILPKMVKNLRRATDGGDLRFWVPGCATGEEVYSLAIVATEALRKAGSSARVQIFGTDLSEQAIAKARLGSYAASVVKNVPPEWVRKYFRKQGDRYLITKSIRDLCTFARQNVPQDPPFSRLDLISCRNVLIYLGVELQRRCFPIFHYSLNPGGYLLLGSAETVGGFGDLFTVADRQCKIYQKMSSAVRPEVEFGGLTPARTELPRPPRQTLRGREIQQEIQREADRLVLMRAAPCGVVTNADLHVLQFRGQTGRYLEHNAGEANLNLLQLAKQPLVMDLRASIHKAVKANAPVYCDDVPLPHSGSSLLVNIEVHPFRVPSIGAEQCVLVLFHSRPVLAPPAEGKARRVRAGSPTEVLRLREELAMTKESLQSIIEEQEATNEELKSANEEIESSNEELQSSNEELETAKEELQSTNEELQTLNEELNTRNTEVTQINNDLENLLASMNLPIVMVDNSLAVRHSTPQAKKVFHLIPSDVGRRISDLSSNLRVPDLDQMIKAVIQDLRVQEREVEDKQGRVYSMRIRPYRTHDNRIDGAVLTLVDIDALKRQTQRERISPAQAAALVELIPQPALALGPDGVVISANPLFRTAFKLKKKETEKKLLVSLHGGAWDSPGWRKYLASVRSEDRGPVKAVLPVKIPGVGKSEWNVAGSQLSGGEAVTILLALEAR